MIFKELTENCSQIKIDEIRSDSQSYCEYVFSGENTTSCYNLCLKILGKPSKPAGTNPEKEDKDLTANFGGIFSNQTLFKKEDANETVLAMFWPWQDGIHTTVKVASLTS